jgi:hypothetical protein
MRLGGGVDLLAPFPGKPKRMHRRTFQRLRARAEAAALCSYQDKSQGLRHHFNTYQPLIADTDFGTIVA